LARLKDIFNYRERVQTRGRSCSNAM